MCPLEVPRLSSSDRCRSYIGGMSEIDVRAFDELPIGHLELQLDHWVDQFPREAIVAEIAELERRRGDIEAALDSLNRRLQSWQAMRAHRLGQDNVAHRPSKRDAVLALLERDPTRCFSLSEIRTRLI